MKKTSGKSKESKKNPNTKKVSKLDALLPDRPKPKKKTGRKKIVIDWVEFDKLCFIQCTLVEIADWLGCSIDTIERRCKEEKKLSFAEYFKKKSVGGKISLRRKQFQVALGGNVPLLIFLGKQYLKQTDGPPKNQYETASSNMDWKGAGKAFAEAASKIATTMPPGFMDKDGKVQKKVAKKA